MTRLFRYSAENLMSVATTSMAISTSVRYAAGTSTSAPSRSGHGFRLSAEYDVFNEATGEKDGYIRIRLDQASEDALSGYNRAEHLRAFPDHDPVFIEIQRRLRASAESADRIRAGEPLSGQPARWLRL